MCPNCFPGTQIEVGWIAALAMCLLFFVVGAVVMVVASKTGYLDNLEDSKYSMLDD